MLKYSYQNIFKYDIALYMLFINIVNNVYYQWVLKL